MVTTRQSRPRILDQDLSNSLDTKPTTMTSLQQPKPASRSLSFADRPRKARDQILGFAMQRSKSPTKFSLATQPPATTRSLAHTSRLVHQEAMTMYYSQYTFWHMVFSFHESGSDDDIYNNAFLQKWFDSWGVLALSYIRTIELDVSERRKGEAWMHKIHIDLDNIDKPVTPEFSYWGGSGKSTSSKDKRTSYKSSNPDANLADVDAIVHLLLVTLPDGKKVFTPDRFKALLKGLWHSCACVGGSSTAYEPTEMDHLMALLEGLWYPDSGARAASVLDKNTVISSKSFAYGLAAKTAEEKKQVAANLLATGL
jgi:hypothetical protein